MHQEHGIRTTPAAASIFQVVVLVCLLFLVFRPVFQLKCSFGDVTGTVQYCSSSSAAAETAKVLFFFFSFFLLSLVSRPFIRPCPINPPRVLGGNNPEKNRPGGRSRQQLHGRARARPRQRPRSGGGRGSLSRTSPRKNKRGALHGCGHCSTVGIRGHQALFGGG